MKEKQHTKKGFAQATMYETAQFINQSYVAENAKFVAFDPDLTMDLSDRILAKLAEISDMDPDFMLEGMQMQATKKVVDLSDSVIGNVRTVKYYVEKAFPGDSIVMNIFGFPELAIARKSQLKLMMFNKGFAKTVVKYKTQLTDKGMSLALLEEIVQQAIDLDEANVEQEQAKKDRYAATGLRIKAYDELWIMVGSIAKAGKLIFENEPDKLRDYILDRSPKKKTVKVADKEVETAVLQGTITDAKTNEVIEDAIIEIAGTDFKTTTDENGEFYIDTVIPATYTIRIIAFGYKQYQQTNVVLNSGNEEQEFSFGMEKQE
jgi:hypothetical protein